MRKTLDTIIVPLLTRIAVALERIANKNISEVNCATCKCTELDQEDEPCKSCLDFDSWEPME